MCPASSAMSGRPRLKGEGLDGGIRQMGQGGHRGKKLKAGGLSSVRLSHHSLSRKLDRDRGVRLAARGPRPERGRQGLAAGKMRFEARRNHRPSETRYLPSAEGASGEMHPHSTHRAARR